MAWEVYLVASKVIVFATHNSNKKEEAQAVLQGPSFSITNLEDYPSVAHILDIPETGSTFAENAQQKVDFVKDILKLSVVADDSGLEIEALNGEPGIHSKRWIHGSDEDRNNHLLNQLKDSSNRRATFTTVLAYYDIDTQQYSFFEGKVAGTIAEFPRGQQGFGYDPLFIPDGYTQTFGELGSEVKNTVSHRARAFLLFKDFLLKQS